ncbi:hypothetical protein SMALA_5037 [Streptomyces malaysiensis subsp. malaysiensis]|nr:hypothetical protein SMALA_5037 [Streptomyces malaysiensis]
MPVVHVYELDESAGAYAPAGIFRHSLQRTVPFKIDINLNDLAPDTNR